MLGGQARKFLPLATPSFSGLPAEILGLELAFAQLGKRQF